MDTFYFDNDERTTEAPFSSFANHLRDISTDNTPLDSVYVSFYRNIYDLINSKDDVGIKNVVFNETNNTVTFVKVDGTQATLSLEDNFLESASYDSDAREVSFSLKEGGDPVKLNLGGLEDKIDKKINDNKLVWGTF